MNREEVKHYYTDGTMIDGHHAIRIKSTGQSEIWIDCDEKLLLAIVNALNNQSELEELRKKVEELSGSSAQPMKDFEKEFQYNWTGDNEQFYSVKSWFGKWVHANRDLQVEQLQSELATLKRSPITMLNECFDKILIGDTVEPALVEYGKRLEVELASVKSELEEYKTSCTSLQGCYLEVKSELENLQEDHKILHNNYHVQAEDEIELKANNKILGDNVTCLRKQLLEITDELKDAEVEANQYRALYETTLSDNKRLRDVVESALEQLGFYDDDYAVGEGNIKDTCIELKSAVDKQLIASLETK